MTDRGILGVDYVILGPGSDRDRFNGATVEGDNFMHLGIIDPIGGSETICHKVMSHFLLSNNKLDITCPECIATLKQKGANG